MARSRDSIPLSVAVFASPTSPVIASEPVTNRDLIIPMAEAWFDGFLRRGFPEAPLSVVGARLRPVLRSHEEGRAVAGAGRPCAGFSLETRNDAGVEGECLFARDALESMAARMARRLVEQGSLRSGQIYFYEVLTESDELSARITPVQDVSAPTTLRASLKPLLDLAEAVDVDEELDGHPVFYTRSAFAKAERVSRKGERVVPPQESGGLLVGTLCSCPESGELFAVVTDVFEAADSEGTTYSLTYSGKTWERIQAVLRARQSQPAARTHRLLGQTHGHNFLPAEGAPPCSACAHVEVCTRTTAFLSSEDRQWCRSVFTADPWQLSQVFGFDARGEKVNAFFGQRGGQLLRRGYHLLDDFSSADFTS